MILAGIDEAGYGPLLGPLVVSATAFEVPGDLPVGGGNSPDAIPCLWQLLRAAVAKKNQGAKSRLLVADSKVVHNLTDGDKLLERAVLTFLRAANPTAPPFTATSLLPLLSCTNHNLPAHPWYASFDPPLPYLADPGDLSIALNVLNATLAQTGVRPLALRSAVLAESAYNALVNTTNNKASALVSITLSHLYHLHTTYAHRGLVVVIDKQGGRDHYTNLLLQSFPDSHLQVLSESSESSSYLLAEPSPQGERRTLLTFREKSETYSFPTALASMTCKYIRELYMHAFNTWWCQQIPNLKPTAGYHQDGTRWLADVTPHLPRLKIPAHTLIRSR